MCARGCGTTARGHLSSWGQRGSHWRSAGRSLRGTRAGGLCGFCAHPALEESMEGNRQDVLAAAEYVRNLPYVDSNRIAILGFSRGGLLTFLAAADRPEDYQAIVIMAAAVGIVNQFQNRIDKIAAPVLLLISENDVAQANHLMVMMELEEVLLAANKETTLIVYPPFGNDGHRMFFEIGNYWQDVESFLVDNLKLSE